MTNKVSECHKAKVYYADDSGKGKPHCSSCHNRCTLVDPPSPDMEKVKKELVKIFVHKMGRVIPETCNECHYLDCASGEDPETCSYNDKPIDWLSSLRSICPQDEEFFKGIADQLLKDVILPNFTPNDKVNELISKAVLEEQETMRVAYADSVKAEVKEAVKAEMERVKESRTFILQNRWDEFWQSLRKEGGK